MLLSEKFFNNFCIIFEFNRRFGKYRQDFKPKWEKKIILPESTIKGANLFNTLFLCTK